MAGYFCPPGLPTEEFRHGAFGNPLDVLNRIGCANEARAFDPKMAPEEAPVSTDRQAQERARLASEREKLALENAQLCWENAMLREQSTVPSAEDWWLPTDPWAAAQAAKAGLLPGVTATLHSLKNASELNGVCGFIEYWDQGSGRWVVTLPNGEEKFVKPENLVATTHPHAAFYAMYCPDPAAAWNCGSKSQPRKGSKSQSQTSSFNSDVSTTVGSCTSSFNPDDDADAEAAWNKPPDSDGGQRTTVMMRNIPNNYTREMLFDLLSKHGFSASCDLIYLPIDFQTEVGLGYAFINLVSEAEVEAFRNHYHGFSEWEVASQKVCKVTWSNPLQGLQAHIDRYRNSPVMHESVPDTYRPMLFQAGVRTCFPPPTKRIRAPRLRRAGPRK